MNQSVLKLTSEFDAVKNCYLLSLASYYLLFLFVISLTLNSTVLWGYMVMKQRKSLEIQTMTLLTVNLISTVTTLPVVIISNLSCKWVGPTHLCILSGFWMYFNGIFSIYLMTGISIERYLLICGKSYSKISYTKLSISFSFALSIFWTAAPLLGWSRYSFDEKITSCGLEFYDKSLNVLSYNITVFLIAFFLPLFLICFFTIGLVKKVKDLGQKIRFQEQSDRRRAYREKELSYKLSLFIFGFFITWLPYTIQALFSISSSYKFRVEFEVFSCLCAKTSLIWTPIFFLYTNKKVRQIFLSSHGDPGEWRKNTRVCMKIMR